MKIIALRGLPGSGKSYIAEKIRSQTESIEIINVDKYKLEFRKNNPDVSFGEALKYSYEQALLRLGQMHKENSEVLVVIEELFNDAGFVKSVQDFCRTNGVSIAWYYIERSIEDLLMIEETRQRRIKNSREDFEKLKEEIERIEIPDEITIVNDGRTESIEEIIRSLNGSDFESKEISRVK